MRISVRPATVEDASAVCRLYEEFARYLRKLGDTTDFKLTEDAYRRDGFGDRPAFYGLIAEDKSVAVGYLIYCIQYDTETARRYLWIADLFVTESARGHGIGRALMEEALRVCSAMGGDKLAWSVYKPNVSAQRFYERIGGEYIGDELYMYMPTNAWREDAQ